MTKQNIETVEAVEVTPEAVAVEAPKSRFASAAAYVKSAPKWVLVAVPAAVVALAGYGYMQQHDNANNLVAQAPMVAGPFGQMSQANGNSPIAPVAYGPGYYDGYRGYGNGYGDGYGRGYGHGSGRGHGRAHGNFSFNMGGDMSGASNGWGNGYGDGYNRYNNGYY